MQDKLVVPSISMQASSNHVVTTSLDKQQKKKKNEFSILLKACKHGEDKVYYASSIAGIFLRKILLNY
jgi:hypothetical protein